MDASVPFVPVYESREGLSVRLETAPQTDGAGRPYTHHRLVVADGRPGAVILAVRGGEILLVRSLRVSVGRELWELPRGAGDAADAGGARNRTVETAVRELREETGYAAEEARLLGEYVTDSTVFPQWMGAVRCEVAADAVAGGTDGEVEEVRWVPRDEVRRLILDGTVGDAHSLSALAMWLAETVEDAAGPGQRPDELVE